MSGHSSTCAARISWLPPGEAVYRDGAPAGFDFSFAQQAGRIALEEGAAFLCGGHVAHWHEWDDSESITRTGTAPPA